MLYVVLYLVVAVLIYILLNRYLPYTGLEYEIDEEINLVYPIDEECYKAVQVCRALLWPILLHGLYDFSLAEELMKINDNFVFLPFIVLGIGFVILIRILLLIKKERNGTEYTKAL